MSKDADQLYAMGFRLVEGEKGFAKAEMAEGVCLLLEKLKCGGWRCKAAMPAMKGKCVPGFAVFTAGSPSEAAKGCLMAAQAKLAYRKSAYETEAARLGRAMGILEGAKQKTQR